MKRVFILPVFLLGSLFLSVGANAQESNYSNYEVGAKATMLGGSVVAGVDNISAVYYNPGALSFIGQSSVTLETSTLFGGMLQIDNGAGQDINIRSNFFDVIPSLIGGVIKSKKKPDWSFAYSSITVNSSFIEFNVRNTMFYDVLLNSPGDEFYEGLYDYSNKIRENWIGATASKKVNENFGIGVSLFGVYFSQNYKLRQSATASEVNGNVISRSLAHSSIQRDLRFGSFGFVLKAGGVYKWQNSSLGFTISSPNLNIDLFAKGDISQTISIQLPNLQNLSLTENLYGGKLTTYHRTPLIMSLGYEREWLNSTWNFSVTYNSPVKEYVMIASEVQIFDQPALTKEPVMAYDMARQIINFSIGLKKDIRDGLSFLGGARTDLNYSSDSFLDSNKFVPKMSYWNLYHVTGGIIWYNEKAHLTLGGDYAFGLSKGDLQQVNLSDPVESELLFGQKTKDTRTVHNQIYVVLGFSYSF
ncbi:MAG: hypothetical protein DRI71_01895 [Bacteroidetes bacterium]|nr:MAG: hypothetical protein DRI71_01895 [Bacteroidota bacterium]